MTNRHSFGNDLAWGDAPEDRPHWAAVIRTLFGDRLVGLTYVAGPSRWQSAGTDYLALLRTGSARRIDTKKLRGAELGIEIEAHGAPGWAAKQSHCDTLIVRTTRGRLARCHDCNGWYYNPIEGHDVYALSMPALRVAWAQHGHQWVKQFKLREADDASRAKVCYVPFPVLSGAGVDLDCLPWPGPNDAPVCPRCGVRS